MTAARVLADWWRHLTYRDVARPHPHTAAALETLRRRRSQDYDPYPGRPS